MSKPDKPTGADGRGFTLSPIYFIYGLVALLAIFWTWKVLIAFAILWGAAMLFAWFDDRRHQRRIVPPPRPSGELSSPGEPLTACPECGGELFSVEPGLTSAEEIAKSGGQASKLTSFSTEIYFHNGP
ncbi:hypothetical protein DESUT3_16030 [Desulfuromonas versatilis]|uniref:Phosphatidylserine decarboxylase family protein n=1 Tax=Desulfuromonas versatilis TaxID=2802975 RepID=A0ABM8HRI8_9BACT|nr:hypothetical protein [Desulfuromonas versatilis]BCR04534.1 hypothetical protein DESUT3_16030 [Desulfuromonas versatilis]